MVVTTRIFSKKTGSLGQIQNPLYHPLGERSQASVDALRPFLKKRGRKTVRHSLVSRCSTRSVPQFARYARSKTQVAPGRFELPTLAPKASMIDRYTTGLMMIFIKKRTVMVPFPESWNLYIPIFNLWFDRRVVGSLDPFASTFCRI